MGNSESKYQKYTYEQNNRFAFGENDSKRVSRKNGHWRINVALSSRPQLANRISVRETQFTKPVYDIRNCGSRHRFAVWNRQNALIVSNCVQAISRDILCHVMQKLKDYRICAHVHDELIIECPSSTSVELICELMASVPEWAQGLPLKADGYECEFYRKD